MASTHLAEIIPEQDFEFKEDKNGDLMLKVRLQTPVVVAEGINVGYISAHSMYSKADYDKLKTLETSSETHNIKFALAQKNQYWNLVKNSIEFL